MHVPAFGLCVLSVYVHYGCERCARERDLNKCAVRELRTNQGENLRARG